MSSSPSLNKPAIDTAVRALLQASGAPGCAIVAVSGESVYARGYGYTGTVGGQAVVTPETLFANASTTKAVTTTALAKLIGERKMGWDDLVRKHLPAFRLSDPNADALVTVRDLVCHRTGLPRHDMLWYHSDYSREELVRRIGFAKPSAPFRSMYQYQNICFTVAGEVVRAVSGAPSFEAYATENLLRPLGMNRANFTAKEAQADPNHATPHRKKKNKAVPIPWLDFDALGCAGTMNSCAHDMKHWLRFQLSGGKALDGTQIVDGDILRQTWRPQIPIVMDDDTRTRYPFVAQTSYALGWAVTNWRGGETVISHAGAIDGFRAQAAFVPEKNVGVVVLVNLSAPFSEWARNTLLDLLLGHEVGDWVGCLKAEVAKAAESEKTSTTKLRETHKNRLRLPLPLAKFAGDYQCPAYGTARVTVNDDKKLHLTWNRLDAILRHQTFTTFETDTPDETFRNNVVRFRLSPAGIIESLELYDGIFVRQETPASVTV